MSPNNKDQKSDQKGEVKPRKKKCVAKRNAESPLNDADHTNNTRVNLKAGGKGKNVSKNNSINNSFPFPFFSQRPSKSQQKQLGMGSKDPKQATPVFHTHPFMGTALSPNMMPSLTKLDQIEKTVNMINMKVTDLEANVNTIEPRLRNHVPS